MTMQLYLEIVTLVCETSLPRSKVSPVFQHGFTLDLNHISEEIVEVLFLPYLTSQQLLNCADDCLFYFLSTFLLVQNGELQMVHELCTYLSHAFILKALKNCIFLTKIH